MDHRSTVKKSAGSSAQTVNAEQAIFTSVRTPTGEGYRIIAAGSGLTVDEKAEITRRAPSHGALCSAEPDARGLSAYPLAGGRYCVAFSRYAGREHTARGGLRVYTRLVVLDQHDYARFGCHPLRVCEALSKAAGDEPILKPRPTLPQLPLPIIECSNRTAALDGLERDEPRLTFASIEQILHLSQAILQGDRTLVADGGEDFHLFDKTVYTLPLVVRQSLALSVGLTYSPSRQLQLCFIARDRGETQRAIRGQEIRWFDVAEPPPRKATPYDAWLGLVEQRLGSGREAEVERLTTAMTSDRSPEMLARVALVCADMDLVDGADLQQLAGLTAKYEAFVADNRLETDLLTRLKKLVKERTVALEKIANEETSLAKSD